MAAAKTARWLDLIAFLLQHRLPVTRDQIFDHVRGYETRRGGRPDHTALESARRTFERDKDELRALGVEIETLDVPDAESDEPSLGYRLRTGGIYLPYLELRTGDSPTHRPYPGLKTLTVTADDLALLDRATRRIAERTEIPLAASARSARRKLEFDLPIPLRNVERAVAAPMLRSSQETLAVLQRAVGARTAVRCRYYTIQRDDAGEREIEPYGLFFSWSRWYCVARARDRDALRVFRVERMGDAKQLTGKNARFVVPTDFDITAYAGRAPWELSERTPTTVTVRFGFPESRWVQAQGLGTPVDPMQEDGGAVIEFSVHDMRPFLRWILTFRWQARVLEPSAVRNALTDLKMQVARLYE